MGCCCAALLLLLGGGQAVQGRPVAMRPSWEGVLQRPGAAVDATGLHADGPVFWWEQLLATAAAKDAENRRCLAYMQWRIADYTRKLWLARGFGPTRNGDVGR